MSKHVQYRVILLPRANALKPKRVNFPPLNNLLLHLLENKHKLKSGLPPVIEPQIVKSAPKKPVHSAKKQKDDNEVQDDNEGDEVEDDTPPVKKEVTSKKSIKITKKSKGKKTVEDELVEALGESDSEGETIESVNETEDDEAEEDDNEGDEVEGDNEVDDEGEEGDSEAEEEGDSEAEEEDDGEAEVEAEEPQNDPYAGLTEEQRIVQETEDYRKKFRILKKKYPNPSVPIPEYTQFSDLPSMKRDYERIENELLMDDNIETARAVLFASFVIIEVVAVQMDIDMIGFTKSQMAIVHRYEKMLVEIGQRPYYSWSSNLPIEIKLGGFVLLQAFLFFIAKIVADRYGIRIAEFFGLIFGVKPVPEQAKKRKMRGPSISKEDIENMTKDKES